MLSIAHGICMTGFVCCALVAQAGVVIQEEGGDVGGAKGKQKMTLYIDAGKIRVDATLADGKKNAVIFDGDKQVIWMLSPEEGTYREMTAADVEGMSQQMNDAMKQMQDRLSQMPPEQRQMMEQMMKQRMGGMAGMGGAGAAPTITIEEKASGEKVGAYTCTRYAVLSDGKVTEEIWAASSDQVHFQESDFKTFQAMAKFYEPLMRNMPKGSWSTPKMEQIHGLPVKTLVYDGDRPAYEWNVVNVEQKSVEASQFTVPSNLKKAEPMGMGMGPGRGMNRGNR